jgi:hypothetical protein
MGIGGKIAGITGDRTAKTGDPRHSGRGRTIRWGIAAALIIVVATSVVVATRTADRTSRHRREIAAANYARVKIGMSRAQVRHILGRRPQETGTTKAPGYFEECWAYDQVDGPRYQVCFQRGEVSRKLPSRRIDATLLRESSAGTDEFSPAYQSLRRLHQRIREAT